LGTTCTCSWTTAAEFGRAQEGHRPEPGSG
jgi:hypothetical protein